MTLRQAIRRAMGEATYARLQMFRRRRANRLFAAKQTTIQLRVGDYVLSAPSNHILARLQPRQPYRDLAIGLVARELARKYPGETLVDVGANIGDTAAIMATYSPSPKILVEPSDFYQGFLRENAARIPNIVQIHQVLVSGREQEQGTLVHWGGRRGSRQSRGQGPGWTASGWRRSPMDRPG